MKVQLPVLKLPAPVFRIIPGSGQSSKIFDTIRRKYVLLTPEEWVRQHLLHYFITEKNFPLGLIAVEKSVKVNSLSRRTDVLVYNSNLQKNITR